MKAVGFDHERPHMDEQNAKTVLGKIIKELQTLRMARVLQTCGKVDASIRVEVGDCGSWCMWNIVEGSSISSSR